MEIIQNKKGEVVFLALKGRFDSTIKDFEDKATKLIKDGEKKLVIDFSELDYINSAGLRIILTIAKNLKKSSGNLVLFGLKEHIKEIFDMTGFSSIINIVGTEQEALDKI